MLSRLQMVYFPECCWILPMTQRKKTKTLESSVTCCLTLCKNVCADKARRVDMHARWGVRRTGDTTVSPLDVSQLAFQMRCFTVHAFQLRTSHPVFLSFIKLLLPLPRHLRSINPVRTLHNLSITTKTQHNTTLRKDTTSNALPSFTVNHKTHRSFTLSDNPTYQLPNSSFAP
jgi:hypothetical protein